MSLEIGTLAPDFTLRDQNKEQVALSDLLEKKTVLVFIPNPNTGVCDGEVCEIRDNWASLHELDANIAVITCHAIPTHRVWAESLELNFPVLSDFWPHGAVSRAYDNFDSKFGIATRTTYFLDTDGIIRDVVASDVLTEARPFSAYPAALAAI